MNAAVDYLHQHGATYPPEVLLAELRRAGYDEPSISAAWHHATTAPPASQLAPHLAQAMPVHHPAVVQQPLGSEHVVSMDGRRQSTPLLIGIVVALAVLLTLGVLAWQSGSDTSDAEKVDARLQEGLKDADLTDEQSKAVVESLGGATIKGSLPSGWTEVREGVWVDKRTGNNINVMVLPNTTNDPLAKIVADSKAQQERLGVNGLGEPTAGTLFDNPSLRLSGKVKGGTVRQEYAVIGDDVAVVTVGISSDGDSKDDRKEAYAVADRLQPIV